MYFPPVKAELSEMYDRAVDIALNIQNPGSNFFLLSVNTEVNLNPHSKVSRGIRAKVTSQQDNLTWNTRFIFLVSTLCPFSQEFLTLFSVVSWFLLCCVSSLLCFLSHLYWVSPGNSTLLLLKNKQNQVFSASSQLQIHFCSSKDLLKCSVK